MPLNQAQALSLATTLRMLEERCDQIEHLLADGTKRGARHHTVRDIPEDIQPTLFGYLTLLRVEIARLAAAFHLGVEPRSATRTLVALLATSTAGPKKHDSFCQLPTADYKRLRSRQSPVGSHTNCDVISAALH